jgi:hypothetical protein
MFFFEITFLFIHFLEKVSNQEVSCLEERLQAIESSQMKMSVLV